MAGNVVEITIRGNDQSRPVLDRAAANTRRLSHEMRGLGNVVGQVGNTVRIFGNSQLSAAVGAIDSAVLATSGLTANLTKSRAGIVALGAAAATAGVAIGDFLRPFIPFFNEPDILAKQIPALERIRDIANQRLALRDPDRAQDNTFAASIDKQINAIEKGGLAAKENAELVFQLEMLKKETIEKNAKDREDREIKQFEDGSKRYEEFFDGLILKNQELDNAELAQFQHAEQIQLGRLEKAREFYQQGIIDEQQFHTFSKLAEETYQKEKSRIAKEQSDIRNRILDEERRKNLAAVSNYLSAAGSIFGSLATIAETQGKKAFGFTQALRYAEAVVNTAAGVARAFAEFPYPYSLAVAATVAAAGAAQIATISAQKPPQAHGGLSYVPEEATYLLSKGERVLAPDQNRDLTEALEGGGRGGYNIDGRRLGDELFAMSKDGRLRIDGRCIV